MSNHPASQPHARQAPPNARRVSFSEAFRFWVKLGFISFGGPAGQIAIMHRELVERRRWLSEERFLHALNYCMLLPGPEAQQLAIYIGWLLHRTPGGLVAGAFFVIPSIFILLALSYVYAAYGQVAAVAGALSGFKPVVVAIVVEAVLRIGRKALRRRAHFVIAALAFVAIYFLRAPFPLVVLAAGLTGLAGQRLLPDAFAPKDAAAKGTADDATTTTTGDAPTADDAATSDATTSDDATSNAATASEDATTRGERRRGGALDARTAVPTVIDDRAEPPPHTRPSRARVVRVLLAGLLLWALPFAALVAWRGPASLHAQEYRFFTQAALVTFGGAYAVLAYVTQAAAGSYGWLTHAQALDGLALAETTPGPLIMVLQFVGFMAAWNNPEGMTPASSAILGALVTTYTTFLPSFVFIFLGAPYLEVLRGNRNLSAALTGITAAVVGVILNLALVFGAAVVFPRGPSAGPDWFSLALTLAAVAALYRLRADVLWVVLAGGLVGLLRALIF